MASIGAAAATALAPRATTAPDSFLELWADRGDALEGNYEALHEKWTSDLTSGQLTRPKPVSEDPKDWNFVVEALE